MIANLNKCLKAGRERLCAAFGFLLLAIIRSALDQNLDSVMPGDGELLHYVK